MPDASPPPLPALEELAARAAGHLEGVDGQAAVVWERVRGSAGEREALALTVTAVVDGRAAVATAAGTGDGQLARAAKAATVNARRPRAWPAPPLPEPAPGRPHDGWDPEALTWAPEARDGLAWEASAARVAIASARGVAAVEQRTHARIELRGGTAARATVTAAAAVGPSDLGLDMLLAESRALDAGGEPAPPPDEPDGLVLGPLAVAALLDGLRPAFGVHLDLGAGPLAGRRGQRVAAPAVNLSDSARYPGTLPRSYDAEGVPRRPVPLIQDGVAHGRVHDSASAARAGGGATSTGHASRAAALAAVPEHLVLVGGGAEGIEGLCASLSDGLYVPALERGADGLPVTRGALRIRAGVPAAPVIDHAVAADALAVLAGVEALDGRLRLVMLPAPAPGGAGAAMVPALRTSAGLQTAAG